MSDHGKPWWHAPGPRKDFTLKVERTGRPPLPWTWEIVSGDGEVGARRSLRGYRSAEEAWAAGRAALIESGLEGGQAQAKALTAEQRAEIARKAAAKRWKGRA